MKNLKITLHLDTSYPVILNRFTTIDSILLSAYYGYKAKKGERLPYDPDHKTVDFIHKENGVFSGSIWYIDRTENIYHDFHRIIKKPEHRKIFDATGKKTASNAKFKGALIEEETMIVKKIHFYIRGKQQHIEALLHNELKSIGQKQRLGFGKVNGVEVEEIAEDKGYKLDENTASKPLPVENFTVKSKKIALFRRSAPYWERDGREACYVPTSALYEMKDNTDSSAYSVAKDLSFISAPRFIYEVGQKTKDIGLKHESNIDTLLSKKKDSPYEKLSEPKKCVFTGEFSDEGLVGNSKEIMTKWRKSFADYDRMQGDGLISKEVMWCMDNMKEIGYSYIQRLGSKWVLIQGKDAKEEDRIESYLLEHKKMKPPFFIGIKDTVNGQHISFKSRISVSNAFYFVQYGNKTLQIDVQLLKDAVKDIEKITQKYTSVSKTHLCGFFKQGAGHPRMKATLKGAELLESEIAIREFHKKYNSDLRNYLNVISFNKK